MDFLKKYGVVLAIIVLAGLWAISGVNSIARLDEDVKAKWSEVDNQYQRRMDLIPNLVETVKGSASFEKSTLTDVINARANATKVTISPDNLSDPEAFKKYEQAQGALSGALSHLMAVSERYPDLKASSQFATLQSQLEGTENRITVARKDYIESVQGYNTRVRTFPGSLWASFAHAQPKQVFTSTAGADKPPAVKF
jgi:LemA protein